jgi:hypothetical protein
MTRQEMINEMVSDYIRELTALTDSEILASYLHMKGVNKLTDQQWAAIKKEYDKTQNRN